MSIFNKLYRLLKSTSYLKYKSGKQTWEEAIQQILETDGIVRLNEKTVSRLSWVTDCINKLAKF